MDRQVDGTEGLSATVCGINGWLPWIRVLARLPEGSTSLRQRFMHNVELRSNREDSTLDGNRFGRRRFGNTVLGTAFLLRSET